MRNVTRSKVSTSMECLRSELATFLLSSKSGASSQSARSLLCGHAVMPVVAQACLMQAEAPRLSASTHCFSFRTWRNAPRGDLCIALLEQRRVFMHSLLNFKQHGGRTSYWMRTGVAQAVGERLQNRDVLCNTTAFAHRQDTNCDWSARGSRSSAASPPGLG
jgi:hypothetical protein